MKGKSRPKGRVRYRKLLAVIMIISLLVGIVPLPVVHAVVDPGSGEQIRANGEFVVYVLNESEWQEMGSLSFGKSLQEKQLDLSGRIADSGAIILKIVQRGGNAAHLDSVLLGAATPSKVDGGEGLPLKKLSVKDNDVIDLDEGGVALTFSASEGSAILAVTGRIEDAVITKTPFHYPVENLYREIDERATFYSYSLNSKRGGYEIGSMIEAVSADQPLFKEYSVPGTGHPEGYTYGWVMNDDKNLYVVMDFTPDNTMDGDKDYGKVYVKTAAGVKEFKISVPDTTWGMPYFVYTDKVGYQHKAYEFVIPLSELGASSGAVQLAFAAYGTAAPHAVSPKVVYCYNPSANNYLAVYGEYYGEKIYAQVVPADGSGGPIVVPDPDNAIHEQWSFSHGVQNPAVACDGINNRYLVVWEESTSDGNAILGKFVDANGKPYGEESYIDIGWGTNPAVAFDPNSRRFIVVWDDYDDRDIHGRLVDADTMETAFSSFDICPDEDIQENPAVACNTDDGLFFVTWDIGNSEDDYDIAGIYLNPSDSDHEWFLGHAKINISQASGDQVNPAVAYDSDQGEMLVVWEDGRNTDDDSDIYGRYVDATAPIGDGDFEIARVDDLQHSPDVAFDSSNKNFLVVWAGYRADIGDVEVIEGQYLQLSGGQNELLGSNFIAVQDGQAYLSNPSIAFNPKDVNFLAAFEFEKSYNDLGIDFRVIGPYGSAPANHAPVANNAAVQTNQDTSLPITLSATDKDEDDALTYSIVSPPQHGTLSALVDNETTYTPSAGYSGPDSFTFKANDGKADSNVATLSITVRPVGNQSPGSGGGTPSVPLKEIAFSDVPSDSWCNSSAARLVSMGAIHGYPDGTFRPNNNITRAEFAKMLVLAMGWKLEDTSTASFPDIDESYWANRYIETGKAHGVLHGYKDGFFRPDKSISRGEIAKIIAMNLRLTEGSSNLEDIGSHWAKDHINACAKVEIIAGYADRTFRPDNPATRCEAAKMIAAMIDHE